jgi:hypothetical protein
MEELPVSFFAIAILNKYSATLHILRIEFIC